MAVNLILFAICIIASIIGSITGIGGGVIIKPVIDVFGIFPASTVSFLSSCTVLSMTAVSLMKSRKNSIKINVRYCTLLAVGSCIGGIIGKIVFDIIKNAYANDSVLLLIQSTVLIILTVFILVFMMYKQRLKTYEIKNRFIILLIGAMLGILSAFLGIGGGPFNIVVLYIFFSMDSKTAAVNSIYIILFSQISNLILTLITKSVPNFNIINLCIMIIAGVCGGLAGSEMLKRMSNRHLGKVFNLLLIFIIFITGLNIIKCL